MYYSMSHMIFHLNENYTRSVGVHPRGKENSFWGIYLGYLFRSLGQNFKPMALEDGCVGHRAVFCVRAINAWPIQGADPKTWNLVWAAL